MDQCYILFIWGENHCIAPFALNSENMYIKDMDNKSGSKIRFYPSLTIISISFKIFRKTLFSLSWNLEMAFKRCSQ